MGVSLAISLSVPCGATSIFTCFFLCKCVSYGNRKKSEVIMQVIAHVVLWCNEVAIMCVFVRRGTSNDRKLENKKLATIIAWEYNVFIVPF